MAKTKNKNRIKIRTGYANVEECVPTLDKENYVEYLRDLYEKPADPDARKNHPKKPGDEFSAYLDELKENAKQTTRPKTNNKPPLAKQAKWKASGINISKRENKMEFKNPSSVDYLQYKLQKEAERFSEVSNRQPDRTNLKENHTMTGQLFKAVADGRFLQVKTLLKNGVKISSKNQEGYGLLVTALHIEDPEQREGMFKYLLKKDADCMAMDEETGRSVLAWACCLNRVDQVAKILQLCQGDIDFSQKDKSGKTVLHHAVISGSVTTVKMLVATMKKYGLSVDTPDELGLTPFLYSKKMGYTEIGEVLLLEGGASRKQFDNMLFRSGTLWYEEGMKLRQREHDHLKRVEKEWYKMNGKLPLCERSEVHGLSPVKLGGITRHQEHVESDSGISSKDISVRSVPSMTLVPSDHATNQPAVQTQAKISGNQTSGYRVMHSVIGKSSQASLYTNNSLSNSVKSLNGNGVLKSIKTPVYRHNPAPTVKAGYDPALSLLAQVDQGSRVDNFVGSVAMPEQIPTPGNALVNPTKHGMSQIDSTQDRGIHTMFTVLSEQKSKAYRATVIEQPRPKTPEPVKPKKQKKTGVSTLAIIMGKDNSGSARSRRKKSARGKSPAAKTSSANGPSRKITKITSASKRKSPAPVQNRVPVVGT